LELQRGGESMVVGEPGAASTMVSELSAHGWEFDLTSDTTAAWVSGYYSGAAPLSRANVLGFALGRVSAPAGTENHRLLDEGDGSGRLEALDSAGSVLKAWRIDSLTDPSSVTTI
jgi:hypothetical protein